MATSNTTAATKNELASQILTNASDQFNKQKKSDDFKQINIGTFVSGGL